MALTDSRTTGRSALRMRASFHVVCFPLTEMICSTHRKHSLAQCVPRREHEVHAKDAIACVVRRTAHTVASWPFERIYTVMASANTERSTNRYVDLLNSR